MNDRQRLEAIVSVVCKYLPPDGISPKDAMTEIISLVDPLPPAPAQPWVGLTESEKSTALYDKDGMTLDYDDYAEAIEAKLKEKNT